MKRYGKPNLIVYVHGDWETVISSRHGSGVDYREQLLDQKPDDEDGGDYSGYRIQCANTDEMVKAYNEFHGRLKLRCFFGMELTSDDKVIRAVLQSGDGYSNDGPFGDVQVESPVSAIEAAARDAITILTGAVK